MNLAIPSLRGAHAALVVLSLLASFQSPAWADLDTATPDALVKLIAKYGSDFTDTLESLPELQPYLAKSLSPQKALNEFLAKAPNLDQSKEIARLGETLDLRAMIRKESAQVPNGVYAVVAQIPPLAKVANDALKEAGMPMTNKNPYEVTSNMSTAQSAHLLTRLALRISEAKGGEKERLIAKFKETAGALRS